jgi:hypothetical protein
MSNRPRRLALERLESRDLLAADFGDAPAPYATLLVAGAQHEAVGPTLGALRDAELDGQPTAAADGDGADDDGVTFATLRAGQLGAAIVVNVQNAPAGAKLDAWIDFNGDGNWGGPGEQIFASRAVTAGDNALTFDVPASAAQGTTFARFRLSTVGALGMGGAASDGEVEDYSVAIGAPPTALGLFAPPSLLSNSLFANFENVNGATTADLDGDGDLDAVVGGSSGGPLVWFENSGVGRLEPRVLSTQQLQYTWLTSGDLDGDGDVDLVATVSDQVIWFENAGNQTFTSHVAAASLSGAAAAALGDADGDGDLDILVGSAVPRHTWLENDGQQTFARRDVATVTSNTTSISPVDMDGDGDLDILATLGSSFAIWYENTGAWTHVAHTFGSSIYSSARAADVDGDGDQDVVTSRSISGGGAVEWHENDGNQVFTAHSIATGTASTVRVTGVADVDGDGDLDVLSTAGGMVAWHKNDGAESFTTQALSPAEVAINVLAGDFDGDGSLDLFSISDPSSSVANRIALRMQLVAADYGDAPAPYPTTIAESGARHKTVGPQLGTARDVDADGGHSLLADGETDDDGVTFGALQVGQHAGTVTVDVQNAPAGAKLDAWIDFNGDGSWGGAGEQILASADVVEGENDFEFDVPAYAEAGVTFARFRLSTTGGLGPVGPAVDGEVEDLAVTIAPAAAASARFDSAEAVAGASGAWRIRAADLDGDGDVDIIHNSFAGLLWAVNNGDGAFTTHGLASTPGAFLSSSNPTIVDLDRDGDLDVLAASAGRLDWFENLGSGAFAFHSILPESNDRVWMAQAGDMDGDGDLDLVVSLGGSFNLLVVLENYGQQRFTQRYVGAVNGIRAIELADLDRDGDLDFVVAGKTNGSTGDLAWFRNEGNFVYSALTVDVRAVPYSTGGMIALAVADLDGDGDLDIAAGGGAGAQNARLAWHERNADGSFTTHAIDFERSAESVVAADIDGDGDFDLLVGGNRPLDLYENLGAGVFSRRSLSTANLNEAAVADFNDDGALDIVAAPFNGAGSQILYFENRPFANPDYGDAPASYGVTRAQNGPVHGGDGPRLGATRDAEADGAPSAAADADAGDDGVTFGVLRVGDVAATITVNVQNASAGARLSAWIDFNGDGAWAQAEEQIVAGAVVVEGDNVLTFAVPADAVATPTFARFRLSTTAGLGPKGVALDGEVEDYAVQLAPPVPAVDYQFIPDTPGGGRYVFRAADLDGDGDADILHNNDLSNGMSWRENLGDGAYLAHPLASGGVGAPSVLATDFQAVDYDRDGDMDIVLASDYQLGWLENNGAQSFAYRPLTTFSTTASATTLQVVDFDGDGDFDILPMNEFNPGKIWWLRNEGGYQTSLQTIVSPLNYYWGGRAVDMDGDGDVDLAIGGSSSQPGLYWLENDGAGAFAAHAQIAGAGVSALVAADLDRDGDMDLVAYFTEGGVRKLEWLENTGADLLVRHTLGSTDFAFSSVDQLDVADLDGDDDLDVVVGQNIAIHWHRNDGQQNFTPRIIDAPDNEYASFVQAADLNGDGDLELITSAGWYESRAVGEPAMRYLPAPNAGNFPQDEIISGFDFLAWQRDLGRSPPFPGYYFSTDWDRSGAVDAGDLEIWKRHNGKGLIPDLTWINSPPVVPGVTGDSQPAIVAASEPASAAAVVAAPEYVTEPAVAANVILTLELGGNGAAESKPTAARQPAYRPVPPQIAARDAALALLPDVRAISSHLAVDDADDVGDPADVFASGPARSAFRTSVRNPLR